VSRGGHHVPQWPRDRLFLNWHRCLSNSRGKDMASILGKRSPENNVVALFPQAEDASNPGRRKIDDARWSGEDCKRVPGNRVVMNRTIFGHRISPRHGQSSIADDQHAPLMIRSAISFRRKTVIEVRNISPAGASSFALAVSVI